VRHLIEYEFRIKINPVLFQQQDQLSFIADLAMVRFLVLDVILNCSDTGRAHAERRISLFAMRIPFLFHSATLTS
jgi:hypothetical protein